MAFLARRTRLPAASALQGLRDVLGAVVGDTVVDDVAWSYEDPPRMPAHQGHLSFDAPVRCDRRATSGVTRVTADGLTSHPTVRHRRLRLLRLRTFSLLGHTFLQLSKRREMRWGTTFANVRDIEFNLLRC